MEYIFFPLDIACSSVIMCATKNMIMARTTIDGPYREERNCQKYGGIMGAVQTELLTHGVPKDYDEQTWIELLIVKYSLVTAEQMKKEGDFVSGMVDTESSSLYVEVGNEHSE